MVCRMAANMLLVWRRSLNSYWFIPTIRSVHINVREHTNLNTFAWIADIQSCLSLVLVKPLQKLVSPNTQSERILTLNANGEGRNLTLRPSTKLWSSSIQTLISPARPCVSRKLSWRICIIPFEELSLDYARSLIKISSQVSLYKMLYVLCCLLYWKHLTFQDIRKTTVCCGLLIWKNEQHPKILKQSPDAQAQNRFISS